MRIGIIGVGNMGGMLAKAFAADPNLQVYIYNRRPEKAASLTKGCPAIHVAPNLYDLVRHSDIVFVCTKAPDGRDVIREIGPSLSSSQTLVTTISAVPCHEWESYTAARVAKVIPSVVQVTKSGIMLVAYGGRFDERDRADLERLLRTISHPFSIEESQIRIASDLSSCSPAFLSFLAKEWATAAAAVGEITAADAEYLLVETLIGLSNLLQSGMTFSDIIAKVSVPGGVTESGLGSLQLHAYHMFQNLHQTTAAHSHGHINKVVEEKK